MLFRDRSDAGRRLAHRLLRYRDLHPLVLAIPRGGVVVAYEVARALAAPLDVWIVRRIGVPFQPELGLGAMAEGGALFLDPELVRLVGVSDEDVREAVREERREVERRVERYREGAPAPSLRGRAVIVIDDGVATGGTLHAALTSIRALAPARVILALPVAANEALASLDDVVDDVVCLHPCDDFGTIGEWYEHFEQTTDEEVVRLLHAAKATRTRSRESDAPPVQRAPLERHVAVAISSETRLDGDLAVPPNARGLVLFAHGSGSSRNSPRNRAVAYELRSHGLGTLLFDLLTLEEEEEDRITGALQFDIERLAERLSGATDWVARQADLRGLPIGYFGASTGAAAALRAASQRPDLVQAIVCRGGRPDLAGSALARVRAPTLFIVGGADTEMLELNEYARRRMQAPNEIAIVPGATHLFEEPGALARVSRLASDWFALHLAPTHASSSPIAP